RSTCGQGTVKDTQWVAETTPIAFPSACTAGTAILRVSPTLFCSTSGTRVGQTCTSVFFYLSDKGNFYLGVPFAPQMRHSVDPPRPCSSGTHHGASRGVGVPSGTGVQPSGGSWCPLPQQSPLGSRHPSCPSPAGNRRRTLPQKSS